MKQRALTRQTVLCVRVRLHTHRAISVRDGKEDGAAPDSACGTAQAVARQRVLLHHAVVTDRPEGKKNDAYLQPE